MKLQNSDVLANLDRKLGHLSENVQCELKQLIHEREDMFPDIPSRPNVADHDVDVGDRPTSADASLLHFNSCYARKYSQCDKLL